MDDKLLTRRQSLAATGGLLLAAPAWSAGRATGGRVVASFSILADLARQVAPPDIEVHALVGADADAHVFEPTPADARRLAEADLVLVNGLGFEGWIDRLVRSAGVRSPVIVASRGVAPRRLGPSDVDPHAWQDLALARRYVDTIAAALGERWPDRAEAVRERTAAYGAQLSALERQVRAWFAAVPRARRRVITSHDAFGYFGAAYEIEFLAPQGWTTGSEPSAAAVARLVRQIREQRVQALFVENISDRRVIERLAADTGVRIGGVLYSDALSAPGGPADSYLKLFEHNARALSGALAA